jgi:hypothetical protein
MKAKWLRCKGNVWCDLYKLDLKNEYVKTIEGVFVVWTGDIPKKVLRVGTGNISRELFKIKNEFTIRAFQHLGVKVSWAQISPMSRNGALVYLYRELLPSMQPEVPKGVPMTINFPWDRVAEDEYDEE